MILTGHEDLRIVKTINGIKSAFEELICEKDYERITVKELCDRAMINKKTFYHYYETLDALLTEIQTELSSAYVERVSKYTLPDELDKVNSEFFTYSAAQGLAYEKITCSGSYSSIRQDMIDTVIANTWNKSDKFNKMSRAYQELLMEYINSVTIGLYRQWVSGGKTIPLKEIIRLSNSLLCHGTEGFLREVLNNLSPANGEEQAER